MRFDFSGGTRRSVFFCSDPAVKPLQPINAIQPVISPFELSKRLQQMYVFKKECPRLLIVTIVNDRAWIGGARCDSAHTLLH